MLSEYLALCSPENQQEGIRYRGEQYLITNTSASSPDVALALAGISEIRHRYAQGDNSPTNVVFVPSYYLEENGVLYRDTAGASYAHDYDLFIFSTDNIARLTRGGNSDQGNELYLVFGAHEAVHREQRLRGE